MKLIDALEILNRPAPNEACPLSIFLVCGFEPLHLKTLLAAQLRILYPHSTVEIKTGLYGNLLGNMNRVLHSDVDSVILIIEWQDLDPRLGVRGLGGWHSANLLDIVESAKRVASLIESKIIELSSSKVLSVCLPTLPLPPLFITCSHQWSSQDSQIRNIISSLAASFAGHPNIRITNPQRIEELSPMGERFDVESEIMTGFPYKLNHASVLADLLVKLVQNITPKKGLITDLDDTLWSGILGEVGIDGVSWSLDQQSHLHGLYQQMIGSLASAGILIGVASKNDPMLVERAFKRGDMILPLESVFPLEVHWGRKSDSVNRILQTWNIGADSVVFVDDSPIEIAEVASAFPQVECILFPKNDYQKVWNVLKYLRDLFGKSILTAEDSFRLQSIRDSEALKEFSKTDSESLDNFLRDANAQITFEFGKQLGDTRAFELINKTNQFNLNGRRFRDADWLSYLNEPTSFILTATYQDKFGPLGKIAVLLGKNANGRVYVDSWVMSCRAFSRHIEHQFLKYLFYKFEVNEIILDYVETTRNGPVGEFLKSLLEELPSKNQTISKISFFEKTPPLHHIVKENIYDSNT